MIKAMTDLRLVDFDFGLPIPRDPGEGGEMQQTTLSLMPGSG